MVSGEWFERRRVERGHTMVFGVLDFVSAFEVEVVFVDLFSKETSDTDCIKELYLV